MGVVRVELENAIEEAFQPWHRDGLRGCAGAFGLPAEVAKQCVVRLGIPRIPCDRLLGEFGAAPVSFLPP
jgi:hypothetical protein